MHGGVGETGHQFAFLAGGSAHGKADGEAAARAGLGVRERESHGGDAHRARLQRDHEVFAFTERFLEGERLTGGQRLRSGGDGGGGGRVGRGFGAFLGGRGGHGGLVDFKAARGLHPAVGVLLEEGL